MMQGHGAGRLLSARLVMACIVLLGMAGTASAKSLYVISNINANPSPVQAYDIQGNNLVYQATHGVPYFGGGAVGLGIDTDSEFLFVTYEVSNTIQLVNAKTMTGEGSVNAPNATNLAGIVVDQDKQLVYTVDRGTARLYVYIWDAVAKTLVLQGGTYRTLPGISQAYGIALDEQRDLLFVADNATGAPVRYFNTSDWSEAGNFSISQRPMGIAVDVTNRLVYTGNAYPGSGSLGLVSRYDLVAGTETTQDIRTFPGGITSDNVVGLAVDQATGLLYMTTGNQGTGGSDRLLVLDSSLAMLWTSNDIGNPTGLCIPGAEVSYNPLNLTKDDGLPPDGCVGTGQQFTYTLCYDNLLNTFPVTNASIVDALPADVDFVSATGGGTYDAASNGVTWNLGTIPAGTPQQCMQLTVVVKPGTTPGSTLVNSAVIDSDETPPTTKNESTPVCSNQPPVCNAGGPYVAECTGITTTVALDGTGSYDPDGDPLTYAWTTDCPGGHFDDPTSPTPVLTTDSVAPFPVVCTASLTVTDDSGTSATCSTTVTVSDQTPPAPALCTITNPVQPVGVNADCVATIDFSVTLTDNCCIDPTTAVVTARLLTSNATLGAVVLDPLPPAGPSVTITGHVEVSNLTCCPVQVEIEGTAWDCSGHPAPGCTTGVYVIDDYPPAGACGLSHDNFGHNWVDNQILLTGNEPTYWSAFNGLPKGMTPFPVLDPGYLPGGPDPDAEDSGDRVLRGYVLAWAVSATGEEIRWNHLAGDALLVNYREGSAWEYECYTFQAVDPAIPTGGATGTPGELHLDGAEYQSVFDQLLLDFYAAGSTAFSGGGHSVAVATDLTMLPLQIDLREGNIEPVPTMASFDVWNMNEVKFSGASRCIWFWDQSPLSNYAAPNYFLAQNLQTDKGRARIDGLSGPSCPGGSAAPLLGVQTKALVFDGGAELEKTGAPLVGAGRESGLVLYDAGTSPPPEGPASVTGARPVSLMRMSEARGRDQRSPSPQDLTRGGTSQKGSILIFPKVEIRWDHCGNLTQDTFLSLANDYPGDVLVQLYFVNGEAPQPATLPRCLIPLSE